MNDQEKSELVEVVGQAIEQVVMPHVLKIEDGLAEVKVVLGQHGERLDGIEQTLEQHGERLTSIEQTLEEHGERLESIDRKLDNSISRLDAHDRRLVKLEPKIA